MRIKGAPRIICCVSQAFRSCNALRLWLQAQRLEQVLRAANVRLDSLSESELAKKITSYAENKTGQAYSLAFYDDYGDGLLHLPLRLLRYQRSSGRITQAAIQRLLGPVGDTPHEIPDLCVGSVLDIHEAAGHVFVSTHINPSAGCELVFSEQFEFQASLTGWLLANLHWNSYCSTRMKSILHHSAQ